MMPILVKEDEVEVEQRRTLVRPVMASTDVNGFTVSIKLINSPTVSGFELVTVNFVVVVPAEIDLFIIRC